jgi:hypothetical protein
VKNSRHFVAVFVAVSKQAGPQSFPLFSKTKCDWMRPRRRSDSLAADDKLNG